VLLAPVDPARVEIKPDGTVYLPWTEYARRLTAAFGAMGWAMVPLAKPMREGNQCIVHYALVVEGRFVADAVQGHPYWQTNRNQDWGDAVESAKSECLRRCCKALGGTLELWDFDWRQEWLSKYAVRVWNQEKHAYWWRRKDRPAWVWEAKPGRAAESEYRRIPDYKEQAESHMAAISGIPNYEEWVEGGSEEGGDRSGGREPGEEG
jgi:hypothetical protein